MPYAVRILDLCTGSGCIAISLTKVLPACRIIASDISARALDVARKNASSHGSSGEIKFVLSDLFEMIEGEFDVIVSNPPYVARHEFNTLQKEVLAEPRMAIDGGEDGLDFYRRIIPASADHLEKDGHLVMETGYGQAKAVTAIFAQSGFEIVEVEKDYNGIDRVVVAKKV
jgi:release factor glutamine methyltransferase